MSNSTALPPDIEIRAAEPDDCSNIAALGRTVWRELANGQPLTRQFIDIGHPVFVAQVANGGLAGYCYGLSEADGRKGYVLSVTLHPTFLRLGIGTRLLLAVIDHFRTIGMESINTAIGDDNHASKTLFKKLGFREARKQAGYYQPGDAYCIFTMDLIHHVEAEIPDDGSI